MNIGIIYTNGAEESFIVSEVSSFQRLKCMQEWYLGWEKVSFLERLLHFRGDLIEGFHCMIMVYIAELTV